MYNDIKQYIDEIHLKAGINPFSEMRVVPFVIEMIHREQKLKKKTKT